MATIPTYQDILDFLEGYCGSCLDSSLISEDWVTKLRDNMVITFIQDKTGLSLSGVKTVSEYYNGNGSNTILLNKKDILELVNVEYVIGGDVVSDLSLVQFDVIPEEGMLRAIRSDLIVGSNTPVFRKGRKNIKITYKVGYASDEIPVGIAEAVKYLTCEKILGQLASRGGGGDKSYNGYSTNYGKRGMYTDWRNELGRMGLSLLNKYFNAVTGE
jgi:hypothetical protein